MKKVLWFSRHKMTEKQEKDLIEIYGEVKIIQFDKTVEKANEIHKKALDEKVDIIAAVMPIQLQKDLLILLDNKIQLISCKNNKVRHDSGEYVFEHDHWFKIIKVEIETEILSKRIE